MILDTISNSKKILLLTHVNPDGDTLGSACAMKEYIGEKADILVQTKKDTGVPYNYKFLPQLENAEFLDTVKADYDLVIALDVASKDRIVDSAREIFDKAPVTINIDHHKTNKGYAKLNLIKGGYSSCGEVLFDFFTENNIPITKNMAEALYVAILTDTGCFKYEATTKDTFFAVSKLTETGIDISDIARKCYDNKPKKMITFQSDVILNAKYQMDDKVVYAIIDKEILDKYNVGNEHTEGIAEILRSISSVDVSIVLKETSNKTTKVSLRSKTIDLTPVVEKFSGGGHKFAAGCTVKKPAKEAIELILDELYKCLKY